MSYKVHLTGTCAVVAKLHSVNLEKCYTRGGPLKE